MFLVFPIKYFSTHRLSVETPPVKQINIQDIKKKYLHLCASFFPTIGLPMTESIIPKSNGSFSFDLDVPLLQKKSLLYKFKNQEELTNLI